MVHSMICMGPAVGPASMTRQKETAGMYHEPASDVGYDQR